MPYELFDAFTGLAALLAIGVVTGLFLCVRDIEQEERHEWTLRPGSRRH
ncbi:MAG TPA: hypothetical protein VFT12_06555 [Thermoanaerobaculia bacterium]|nr:hypothetical protein [Thermoanaerobaculia bacterium]